MILSTLFLSLIAIIASAAPVTEADAAPTSINVCKRTNNFVQNYNGKSANFKYSQSNGTFSVNWNNLNTDFVVGLGWFTGTGRTIKYSGTYNPGKSGSYQTIYGWLDKDSLCEYYVMDNYGSYKPCNAAGHTKVGSLVSDGGNYTVCTHTQVNQPSIVGTTTFPQFYSVRTTKRSSGSVNMTNHFNYWAQHGFANKNFNLQVLAVEGFSGTGTASMKLISG